MRKTRTLQIMIWGLLLILLAGGCARTEKPDQIPETASITETTEAPEAASPPRTVSIPCETHILLDSALVLDEKHLLKKEIRDEFQLEKKFKSYSLAYFETPDRAFGSEGWINRVRMRDGKADKGFELTYKKRYRVEGNDPGLVLSLAEAEGFDLSDENWEAEVEWNHSGMILSISAESKGPADGLESVADLSAADGISMLKAGMPPAERNWKSENWGIRTMEEAEMAGPAHFDRFTGIYLDHKIQIEIWEFPHRGSGEAEYITELSFKDDSLDDAAAFRGKLTGLLMDQGVLVQEDALKTKQILDAHFDD
ncbi:MAG: hypothetical protein IKH70_00700 [Stomatobaculum sp.]|nr:hypothetical protein [Stomatobaculum sp.]